jgi:hypothetical protein
VRSRCRRWLTPAVPPGHEKTLAPPAGIDKGRGEPSWTRLTTVVLLVVYFGHVRQGPSYAYDLNMVRTK